MRHLSHYRIKPIIIFSKSSYLPQKCQFQRIITYYHFPEAAAVSAHPLSKNHHCRLFNSSSLVRGLGDNLRGIEGRGKKYGFENLSVKLLVRGKSEFVGAMSEEGALAEEEVVAQNNADATVIDEEVKRFSDMSEKWWDADGPMQMLHIYNPHRVEFVKQVYIHHLMNSSSKAGGGESPPVATGNNSSALPFQGLSILDAGCGGGIMSEVLCRLGGDVTGVDVSKECIEIARYHWETVNSGDGVSEVHGVGGTLKYLVMPLEAVVAAQQKFDIVVSSEVLEHVESPQRFFSQLAKCVKPNGILVTTTLNRTYASYFSCILMPEYILRKVPKGVHSWRMFVTPQEQKEWAKKEGMQHLRTSGHLYIPALGIFISDPFAHGMYMISFAKDEESN